MLREFTRDRLIGAPDDPDDGPLFGALHDLMTEHGLEVVALRPSEFPSEKRKTREREERAEAERQAEAERRHREMMELLDWLDTLPPEKRAEVKKRVAPMLKRMEAQNGK